MRNRMCIAAWVLVVAASASTSTAWAGWGCGAIATTPKIKNFYLDVWNRETEADARAYVCEGYESCRIISCQPDVDTKDQALAIWPIKKLTCGPGTKNKC